MRVSPSILLAAALPVIAEDESSFATPPAADWLRLDPLGSAEFDFSDGQCRITSEAPSSEVAAVAGPARAGLYAPGVYADSVASADLTAWVPTTDRSVDGSFPAVMTRIQSPVGAGMVDGYGLSIIDLGTGRAQLQIHRLDDEVPILLVQPVGFFIDPNHDYRLVFASRGNVLIGRVFDLTVPGDPLAETFAFDDTYATGRTGLSISTDRLVPVDVTFDNFLAWDGTPPPLSIRPGIPPGTIELSADAARLRGFSLETTTDLTQLEDFWEPASPESITQEDSRLILRFPIDGPRRFFRLMSF